jgi:hypothetical protein
MIKIKTLIFDCYNRSHGMSSCNFLRLISNKETLWSHSYFPHFIHLIFWKKKFLQNNLILSKNHKDFSLEEGRGDLQCLWATFSIRVADGATFTPFWALAVDLGGWKRGRAMLQVLMTRPSGYECNTSWYIHWIVYVGSSGGRLVPP